MFLGLLSGCAVNLSKTGGASQLAIPGESRSNLVVAFDGNSKVEANPQWGMIKTSWRNALLSEASSAGYSITERPTPVQPENTPGTIIQIDVSNFRYMTPGMRYGLGIMAGNAWVDADVTYRDLQTGETIGVRKYNTSSSAWEGVFSAMTEEQLQALAKEIVAEIKTANVAPSRSVATTRTQTEGSQPLSESAYRQRQLDALMQQDLPYEQYQRRYREIMGE